MERLTEKFRNSDGTGISKKSLVIEQGMRKGMPSGFCSAIVTKCADYEDLEEKGLLLRLLCKVGDTVYAICTCEAVGTVLDGTLYDTDGSYGTATGYYCPYEINDKCPHIEADDCTVCKNIEAVFEDTVNYINITEHEVIIGLKNTNLCVTADAIGKTVFLTQSEAEEALRKMNEREE